MASGLTAITFAFMQKIMLDRPKAVELPWFTGKSAWDAYKALDVACVYAVGPSAGRPVMFGWTQRPLSRFESYAEGYWDDLVLHEITWAPDKALAKRLVDEMRRLMHLKNRGLRDRWFDVTSDFVLPLFQVAGDNLKIPTFTHDALIERVAEMAERKVRAKMG